MDTVQNSTNMNEVITLLDDVTHDLDDVTIRAETEEKRSFIEKYPAHAAVYLVLLFLVIPIGTFGNVMILGAHYCYKKLRRSCNAVIINLTLSDLCVTAVVNPLCAIGTLKGERYFDDKPVLCGLIASMCLTTCFTAFLSLFLITATQYLFVCHNHAYHKVINQNRLICACVMIWCTALAFELPNYIGTGNFVVDTRNQQCIWLISVGAPYLLSLAGMLGPITLSLIAYSHMFHVIKKTKRGVLKYTAPNLNAKQQFIAEWAETVRACRTLVLVVVAFVVCWMPDMVMLATNTSHRLPIYLHIWPTYLAHLRSALNFWIYLATNKDYRHGFARFLRLSSLTTARKDRPSHSMTDNMAHSTKSFDTIRGFLSKSSEGDVTHSDDLYTLQSIGMTTDPDVRRY